MLNRQSDYQIVFSQNAGEAIRQAALELQQSLEESIGCKIPLRADAETSSVRNLISLGRTVQLLASGLEKNCEALGSDGFHLTIRNGCVYLQARTERGILYGAYDFLERIVGVRYFSQDCIYIPKRKDIPLEDIEVTEIPAIPNRVFLNAQSLEDAEYCAHMRMNNEYIEIPERLGGRLGMYNKGIHPTHNTLDYIPKELYEKHPDWFYKNPEGKIIDICYANAGITEDGRIDETLAESPVKTAIESLKKFILNSHDKYFMIGQMDSLEYCDCEKCRAQEMKYRRSGMNIRFVNAISDGIMAWMTKNKIRREIIICTFSYHFSAEPPVDFKTGQPLDTTVIARDNVAVRLAPIQGYHYYGMLEEGQLASVKRQFLLWPKVAKRFMVWTYNINYAHYPLYFPTTRHWQEDFRLYRKIGAEYVMVQSAYNEPVHWTDYLEGYLASKLMWDPEQDLERLREEFLSHYYGPAAGCIREFLDRFDERYASFLLGPEEKRPKPLMNNSDLLDPTLYSREFWETQFALLENAFARAQSLEETARERLLSRIRMVQLTPQYMVAVRFDDYYPGEPEKKHSFLKAFFDNCAKTGLKKYYETKTLDDLKKSLGYSE